MAQKKFTAPTPPASIIQAAAEPEKPKEEFYRFNCRLPKHYGDCLKEMAWRNRTTIGDLICEIIGGYVEAHPEWEEEVLFK